MSLFRRFLANAGGATAIEYGLIAGIMAVAIVAGAPLFTAKATIAFERLAAAMEAATG